jgi:hypothetical protein
LGNSWGKRIVDALIFTEGFRCGFTLLLCEHPLWSPSKRTGFELDFNFGVSSELNGLTEKSFQLFIKIQNHKLITLKSTKPYNYLNLTAESAKDIRKVPKEDAVPTLQSFHLFVNTQNHRSLKPINRTYRCAQQSDGFNCVRDRSGILLQFVLGEVPWQKI